jgi:antitoxin component YwqK of YwqJK toxin-antitoxin module
MKHLYLFLVFSFFSVFCFSQDIELRDSLYYQGNSIYTGKYSEYNDKGVLTMQMNIVAGKPEGECSLFFENGNKKELRSYKNGMKNGTWTTWDESGNKTAEANYTLDLKDGKWYIWNSKGQKLYDMTYSNGAKTGTWQMWDDAGKLIMEKNY